MYKLNEILKRDIKNEKITILISVLVIINFTTLELYMFIEKGIMMLSVFLTVLAIGHIEEALKCNKKDCILIFLEMFAANCCYQGTVGLFFAIGSIYIIKNSKNLIGFVKNNFIVGLLYVIPALLNLLIVKFIFNSDRLENPLGLRERIVSIVHQTANGIINTFGILPKYLFLGFITIFVVVFVIRVIRNNEKISKKILSILGLIYVMVAVVLSAISPQVVSAQVYMVPRNVYCLGALVAIILIFMYGGQENKKATDTIVMLMRNSVFNSDVF